ncbi:MAG: hypothetical protein RBS78_04685 [Coriobacteriia bacterium]|jgi:hypothetical protein|nr:hypothetical protein [Coriobacteriia bacterium]
MGSARHYDPATRQFLSKDPAKDDGGERVPVLRGRSGALHENVIDMEQAMQRRGRVEFEDGSALDIVWTITPEGDEILKSVTVVP